MIPRGGEGENLPCRYTEIRALTAHLKLKPLVELMFLLKSSVRKLVVGVILLDQVLNYSPGLPESNVGIGVIDSLAGSTSDFQQRKSDTAGTCSHGTRPLGLTSV